jgi:hypothetical protein
MAYSEHRPEKGGFVNDPVSTKKSPSRFNGMGSFKKKTESNQRDR